MLKKTASQYTPLSVVHISVWCVRSVYNNNDVKIS
jgi:hypothetical protein